MALILVVEDNELNADMLSRRLRRAGHDVVVGTDGEAGVRLTRAHQPDLVLMDMSLPVMDGWTATRAIKADPSIAGSNRATECSLPASSAATRSKRAGSAHTPVTSMRQDTTEPHRNQLARRAAEIRGEV